MVKPLPIHLSLEEVAVLLGHKVLTRGDVISALIVSDQQGILGQQLRPHLMYCCNITTDTIVITLSNYVNII